MELKAGYLVELNGNTLCMVTYGGRNNLYDSLCISGPNHWYPAKNFGAKLEYAGVSITKVYGRASNYSAYKLEVSDRKLLWDRKKEIPVEMTLEELEQIVGHKIKIIG